MNSACKGRAHGRTEFDAVNHLKVRSCLIDGEVVCCDERGPARFDVLRRRRNEAVALLYAFDLLELDGTDLRREPLEVRKATLASILRKSRPGLRLNEYVEHPEGMVVFQHACQLDCEGIVSKRLGSRYRSGRSPDWLKFKIRPRRQSAGRRRRIGDDEEMELRARGRCVFGRGLYRVDDCWTADLETIAAARR